MAGNIVGNRCATCNKAKTSFRCEGCSQCFCFNHVTDHRQELSKELDQIEVARDLFRQNMIENTMDLQENLFATKINEWEENAIQTIRQIANKARNSILQRITDHRSQIENRLAQLSDQLRQNRQENDFVETDLNRWKEELTRLEEISRQSINFTIQQTPIPLVTKIIVAMSVKTDKEMSVQGSSGEDDDISLERPYEESPRLSVKQEKLDTGQRCTDMHHQSVALEHRIPLNDKEQQPNVANSAVEAPFGRCVDIKECPMCGWSFPYHMSPDDKKGHVESHFD